MIHKFYAALLIIALTGSVCLSQKSLKPFIVAKDYKGIFQCIEISKVKPTQEEFFMLKNLIKDSDEETRKIIAKEMGGKIFISALNFQNLGGLEPSEEEQIFEILLWLREEYGKEGAWEKWGIVTNRIAGNAYYMASQLQKIGTYYKELISKADLYSPEFKISACLMAGNHFMGLEQNFELAESYFKKALEVDSFSEAKVAIYGSISELYLRKNDFDRALEYANKVLSEEKQRPDKVINQWVRIGNIYKKQGELDKSKAAYLKAEKTLPKDMKIIVKNPFILNFFVEINVGLLDIELINKNLAAAEKYELLLNELYGSAPLSGQGVYKLIEHLMKYYNATNNHEGFLSLEEKIIKNGDGFQFPFFAKIETERGDYWAKNNNPTKALNLYNSALNLLRDSDNQELNFAFSQDQPHALLTLSKKLNFLYEEKQKGVASKELNEDIYLTAKQAVLLLDQIRKTLSTKAAKLKILEIAPQIYEHTIEIVYERYLASKDEAYLKEIYSLIESSKAMLLLEALNEDDAKDFGGVPVELREEERSLKRDLKFYEVQLYKAELEKDEPKINSFQDIIFEKRASLEKLKTQLEQKYEKYFALKYENKMASINEVQEELKKNQAVFVSYFVGKRNLYIFSADGQDYNVRIAALPNNLTPNFERNLINLRFQLSNIAGVLDMKKEKYQDFTQACYRFYKLLLEEELLKNNSKRLVLSLDGLLHYVPFEALLTQKVESENMDFQHLPYLLKKYQVSYNYTATLWLKSLEPKTQKAMHDGVLGMAATYTTPESKMNKDWKEIRKSLSELAGAVAEVDFLSKTYKGTYWIGETATEDKFKQEAGNYNMIHLAMHGLVDNNRPMNSGLVFTENGDSTTENILLAYELSSLDLHADLLVLSACSTGDGQYQKGEGVMSLGRGFMYAGASSILTTLWQINDQSSQQIMQYFYQNLESGMDKDEALQQAKISYINNAKGVIAHPAFWAAYVLMGNQESVSLTKSTNYLLWGGLIVFVGIAFGLWSRRKA